MLTADLRLHNVNLDGAPVREDDPSHAAQLARARRSTYAECWDPRCAPMAGRAAPPRPQFIACARTPRRRRERHSAIRRLRVVRAPRRKVGLTCAHGDVRSRGILRRAVRRVPELRARTVRRDHPARRGGALVRPVLHHRQGNACVPQ
jgi:hypothetical protein